MNTKRQESPALFPALLGALLLAVTAACEVRRDEPAPPPSEKGTEMARKQENKDQMFDEVRIGELGPNLCSPKPPDAAFKGILINAPSLVSYKKGQRVGRAGVFARVPVCGYYRLSPASPPRKGTIMEAMTLVAVNVETGQRHAGAIIDPDLAAPPPDRPAPSRATVANITVAGYFNPNLADYVRIPPQPATYDVNVELDGMKSNIVRIQIVEAGD